MPEETKKALQEEIDQSNLASPFIDQTIAWFEDQIKHFDSIDLALNEAESRNLTPEEILNALNICKKIFEEKKAEFMNLNMNLKKS